MHFNNAKNQFNENLRLFGNSSSAPEKFNLYAGLANLAEGLSQLQNEVRNLNNDIDSLRRR